MSHEFRIRQDDEIRSRLKLMFGRLCGVDDMPARRDACAGVGGAGPGLIAPPESLMRPGDVSSQALCPQLHR